MWTGVFQVNPRAADAGQGDLEGRRAQQVGQDGTPGPRLGWAWIEGCSHLRIHESGHAFLSCPASRAAALTCELSFNGIQVKVGARGD